MGSIVSNISHALHIVDFFWVLERFLHSIKMYFTVYGVIHEHFGGGSSFKMKAEFRSPKLGEGVIRKWLCYCNVNEDMWEKLLQNREKKLETDLSWWLKGHRL